MTSSSLIRISRPSFVSTRRTSSFQDGLRDMLRKVARLHTDYQTHHADCLYNSILPTPTNRSARNEEHRRLSCTIVHHLQVTCCASSSSRPETIVRRSFFTQITNRLQGLQSTSKSRVVTLLECRITPDSLGVLKCAHTSYAHMIETWCDNSATPAFAAYSCYTC